jgi:glycosyltransferase involved in cell wall biosynthesis
MTALRVLHVLDELKPSGAEVMMRVAAPHWRARGIRASIVAKGLSKGPYAGALARAGYPVHHLPFDVPALFAARWVRLLWAERPDVVHVHTEHANFWVALLARVAGVRAVVRTVHNVFAFEGALRRRRTVQRALLRVLGVRHASVSASVQRSEAQRFNNPTRTVRNWYDDAHFVPPTPAQRAAARARWGLAPSTFVVATVGNCNAAKNHGALIEALRRLPPSPPVAYLHAGIHDTDPGRAEVRKARALGVDDRVLFLGFLEDVRPVLYAADAFVMPSRFEGLGNSAVEAMGSGTPALLADVPGLRTLKGLSEGIRWAAPTPDALATALAELMRLPPERRRSIGKALHRAVAGRMGPQHGVDAYHALYRRALGRPDGDATRPSDRPSPSGAIPASPASISPAPISPAPNDAPTEP